MIGTILFYPITFVGLRGTTDEFATIPFHLDMFSAEPGRVAQSVGHLTRKSEVLVRYPVWPQTFVSSSADSRGTVVSYWRKYVTEVMVNRLGGLSLPRKSVG